jgi:hypothetical protein
MNSKTTLMTAVLSTAAGCAGAQPLKVFVHNYAQLSQIALERAQTEAARILKTGGADVNWIICEQEPKKSKECSTSLESPDSTELVLLLLPSGATRRLAQADSMGFAILPERGLFGSFAGIFCDRLQQLRSGHLSKPVLLGHVIAHELGHLLLGEDGHALDNIMKPEWDHKQIAKATLGILGFFTAERRLIEENVRRRLAASRYDHKVNFLAHQ